MNLTYRTPPDITGKTEADAAALNEWCRGLMAQLKALLQKIDGSNITSVGGGKIDLSGGGIKGQSIEITADGLTVTDGGNIIFKADSSGVTIQTADGSRYIKCSGSGLEIKAGAITCDSITANTYNNLPQ